MYGCSSSDQSLGKIVHEVHKECASKMILKVQNENQ